MSYEQQILTEIRELRREVNEFRNDTIQRIAVLESQMDDVRGARGGRLGAMEIKVKGLENMKWYLTGAGAVLGVIVGTVLHFVFRWI